MQNGIGPAVAADRGDVRVRIGLAAAAAAYLALLALSVWALFALVPDRISLSFAGRAFALGDLHRRVAVKGVVLAVILPVIFLAEAASVGWDESSLRAVLFARTASMKTDIVSVLAWLTPLMSVLSAAATFGVVLIAGGWLHNLLQRLTGQSFSVAAWPLAAQIAATFTVFSFFDYWSHRLDHSSAFWPLHRFHHSAEEFCVLTSSRTHPAVFTAIVGATLPGAVICASPGALLDMNLLVLALRFLIHSRIESDFGWIGRWLIQSPPHHRLHHRLAARAEATNFSLAPIWDHLFRTWAELPPGPAKIGVRAHYRHGGLPLADAWRDYAEFWRICFGRLRPRTAP